MSGVYCLLLEVKGTLEVSVGRLGVIHLPPGYLLYIGSAQRNLEARLYRHLRKDKKVHWHIDYLTTHPFISVLSVWVRPSAPKQIEESTAKKLSRSFRYIPGFGSTDSTAPSHLFLLTPSELDAAQKLLSELKFVEFSVSP